MITPERAPVRPRVMRKGGDVSFLLEEEIGDVARCRRSGVVLLRGGPGSGKSTALRHLAAVLTPERAVQYVDSDEHNAGLKTDAAVSLLCGRWLVVTTEAISVKADVELELVPWRQDEWIEYLLSCHPAQCKSVMGRLLDDDENHGAVYSAETWHVVLDEMAADATIASPLEAMICALSRHFSKEQQLALSPLALDCLRTAHVISWKDAVEAVREIDRPTWRLLNQPLVVRWIAAAYAARLLKEGCATDEVRCLADMEKLPRGYLYNLASLVRRDQTLLTRLLDILRADVPTVTAAALSAVHLSGALPPTELFARSMKRDLTGAVLEGAQWPGIVLSGASLISCDLSKANLSRADLECVRAWLADFSHADLHEASLTSADLRKASLVGGNLFRVKAPQIDLFGADCRDARFEGADLSYADFRDAALARASFCGARLIGAKLLGADIDGADFTRADLGRATLDGLTFSAATFLEAKFLDASCQGCNLDGVELPLANCADADFRGATFTGATMRGAKFRGACLCDCGLADVDWEGVDLRDADLRGAVFSMGGSRSGLVGSPYPSHGTRTGFYTDDFNDLSTHKHPEEIRKANLCGADLRGANIDGVDFYLVDLRGALYDGDRADQLRRCGAILREPVA